MIIVSIVLVQNLSGFISKWHTIEIVFILLSQTWYKIVLAYYYYYYYYYYCCC
jgi:hypothetical protein